LSKDKGQSLDVIDLIADLISLYASIINSSSLALDLQSSIYLYCSYTIGIDTYTLNIGKNWPHITTRYPYMWFILIDILDQMTILLLHPRQVVRKRSISVISALGFIAFDSVFSTLLSTLVREMVEKAKENDFERLTTVLACIASVSKVLAFKTNHEYDW
jgi:hypothetical protein